MKNLSDVKVGDTVHRYIGNNEFMMSLRVTEVTDTRILCGGVSGWTFSRRNGAEIDEDLDWGENRTGSIIYAEKLEDKEIP